MWNWPQEQGGSGQGAGDNLDHGFGTIVCLRAEGRAPWGSVQHSLPGDQQTPRVWQGRGWRTEAQRGDAPPVRHRCFAPRDL